MQISFYDGSQPFVIDKPIRLIELFAGYGSQAFALKYLGVEFEHWKTCEWAVKSIQAYKDAHFPDDNTDYSAFHSDDFILKALTEKGISADYNQPMTEEQIKRLGVAKQRQIYNNCVATNNLVNIQQAKGEDLEIVDTDKYCYVMTYSFPCQDLSSAGLGKGMEKGSGTRSGMLWEVERLLDECKDLPQVLLMENVPEVIGSNNIEHFAKWLEKLESLGYHCYWKVLNAKDFGVPQNRERCFMVSVLGDYYYEFPKPIKLEHRLKDLLEDEVDEKFYLSDKMKEYITSGNLKYKVGENNLVVNRDIAVSKTTRETQTRADCSDYISDELPSNFNLKKQLCNYLIESGLAKEGDVVRHSYTNNRFNQYYASNQENHDCSPTLDTRRDCLGVCVNDEPKVIGGLGEKKSNGGTQWYQQDRIYDDNVAISVTTSFNPYYAIDIDKSVKPSVAVNFEREKDKILESDKEIYQCQCENGFQDNKVGLKVSPTIRAGNDSTFALTKSLRIRKLTPKECFRLMGVKDEDFDKIAQNQSNASLYHLAGDSIVVDVLMAIFRQLCKNK